MSTYTRRHRSSLACLVGLAIVATAGMQAWGLNPALPPGSNFDLSHWYLGLPVDSSGGTSGPSASISAAQLVAGFTNDYFYTGTDGAMVFWAPVWGTTTPNSDYPRSELREQIVPGDNDTNWEGYGLHILDAQCKVTQLSADGEDVIIGQIHSKTGLARPLLKLMYDGSYGGVRAKVKKYAEGSDDSDATYSFPPVSLHSNINYNIEMDDGVLAMTVNGTTYTRDVFGLSSTWEDEEFYFKAGSYCQDNNGFALEGARVAFYSLTASHDFADRSFLTVASSYGTPTPSVGTELYDHATPIDAWVLGSPVYEGSTNRHILTGWTGTGDVGTGSTYYTTINLTQDSTLTWQWQTEYWLNTAVSGNGSVDVADSWLISGTNVTITATPDVNHQFVSWSGDSSSTNPVLILTMDATKSVTANFATNNSPPDVYIPLPEFVGGGVQFTLTSSVSGLYYQLEYTDALTTTNIPPIPIVWDDMGSAIIGDGGSLILTDPGPLTSNRFYRFYMQP